MARWQYLQMRLVAVTMNLEKPTFQPIIEVAQALCTRIVSMSQKVFSLYIFIVGCLYLFIYLGKNAETVNSKFGFGTITKYSNC